MRDKFSDYDLSSSTILTSGFGKESARLIHMAQKNLYIVNGLIVAIVVLSILNIIGALGYFSTSSEQVDKNSWCYLVTRLNYGFGTISFTFAKV